VQDRYPDDVGQFVKVALLSRLVAMSPHGLGHRLWVIWLQEPGGRHRLDGDHLAYLHSTPEADDELRALDPDLYDQLRVMAARAGRPLSVRETYRALPTDTVRFDRPLRFDDRAQDPADGRQRWFHDARVAISPCSLVFLDSDNGVGNDGAQPPSRQTAECSFTMSEIAQLVERGHSVVTHQLLHPSQAVPRAAMTCMSAIHDALDIEPTTVTHDSLSGERLFMVIAHHRHRADLEDRIGALALSRLGDDFRVHRWRTALLTA
jgi:hypothetical protein